jgi:hypothetical protein
MDLWIRCGNENTMGWKKFSKIEKCAAGQVEHESHGDGFLLTLRVLCIMNSYVSGKQ